MHRPSRVPPDHPLISAELTGCPYRMITYREDDLASVDTSFGVQVHHPRFLECVGSPESARLLGRPPTEWLSVMDRRDALYTALQLQRDARLMSSNLTVLHQYVIALHRISTEVLHTVFGWSSSLWEQWKTLRRYPASFRRQHRWQRWDFGVPRLARSVPGRILRTMTKTAQVVTGVICGRPVSS